MEAEKHMKVVVIGSGRLGRTLHRKLKDVPGFVSILIGKDNFDELDYNLDYSVDILNWRGIRDIVQYEKPFAVVNCAALTDVEKTETDLDYKRKAFDVNVDAALKIGEISRDNGAFNVFISTDYVWSENSRKHEDGSPSDPCPINIYGRNKLEAEEFLESIFRNSPCMNLNVRCSWMYDFQGKAKKCDFPAKILEVANNGRSANGPHPKLPVDTLGYPVRYEDVARGIVRELLEKSDGQFDHYGTVVAFGYRPKGISRYEFGQTVVDCYNEAYLKKKGTPSPLEGWTFEKGTQADTGRVAKHPKKIDFGNMRNICDFNGRKDVELYIEKNFYSLKFGLERK